MHCTDFMTDDIPKVSLHTVICKYYERYNTVGPRLMLFLGPRKNRIKRNPHYGRYLKKHLKIFRKTALLRGLYTH